MERGETPVPVYSPEGSSSQARSRLGRSLMTNTTTKKNLQQKNPQLTQENSSIFQCLPTIDISLQIFLPIYPLPSYLHPTFFLPSTLPILPCTILYLYFLGPPQKQLCDCRTAGSFCRSVELCYLPQPQLCSLRCAVVHDGGGDTQLIMRGG